jgi:uncharacterized membrane protein
MSVQGMDAVRLPARWPTALALAVSAAFAFWFIAHNVFHYLSYDAVTYDDLWPRRFGLIPHMIGGVVAILVGLVQLWLGLTGRTYAWHRALGRVYLGAVALASAGAFYLALTIDPKHFPYAIGLFSLGVAWLLTTGMAYLAIRRGAMQQHREWMIRSYIVTFGFVTFRVFDQLFVGWKIASEIEVDTAMAFACYAIPLLLAEPLLQLRKIPSQKMPVHEKT